MMATTMIAPETAKPAEQVMGEIVTGFWLSRAVCAAARLGIADYLSDVPRYIGEIAAETGCHPDSLYRLMRTLAAAGIFEEFPGARFAQTYVSETLRSDVPGSMRWNAIVQLGEDHYEAWQDVATAVRTGDSAFQHHFGMSVWQYYNENPERGWMFEQSMTGFTQRVDSAVIGSYSFAVYKKILDVGGGEGHLLGAALQQNPAATGILFDQPQVIEMALRKMVTIPSSDRITPVGGDFFATIPEGADLHIMKWVIHDWDDENALQILMNSRRSLALDGRLLLIESPVPAANDGLFPKLMDLNMLVMTGGRERTESEYRALLDAAGYRLARILPTRSFMSLLEAEPV